MQIPLQITFEGGLTSSDAVRARIEQETAKLERLCDRITSCRVAVIGRSGRHRHGDLFGVRLQLTIPGRADVMIDRNPSADHAHEDVYVAIRDAFTAARRRLQDIRRKAQGKVKVHEAPPHGIVARVFPEEGYGFIQSSDGREIYFHRNALVNGVFERIAPGVEVRFAETDGDNGAQASTVHVIGKSHVVAAA